MTSERFLVTFPRVMSRLDYARNLGTSDYTCVIVDGAEIIPWYFRSMTGGASYESYVHSEENRLSPHRLTRANFKAARWISSLGWSYEGVEDLINKDLPQLSAISCEADPLVTGEFDSAAADLFASLCMRRGIKGANAGKLLYQKRPRFIPILDEFARRAYSIPWIGKDASSDYARLFTFGLTQIREIWQYGQNNNALNGLIEWIEQNPSYTNGCDLSRVRILDILAWGAIRRVT